MPVIAVRDLVKTFTVTDKRPGFQGAFQSLFSPKRRQVRAVDGISFDIPAGQVVGYLGPNGAGKSTTIKMLTGILHPTSGSLEILGMSPAKNRSQVVSKLGVVFGQRTQLYWDLRLGESFTLLKHLYQIEESRYRANLDWVCEKLGVGKLMSTPVRQLSLGERMRGDLAAAIIHSPPILFLDEPTIGLDIEAKHAVRDLIKQINRERGTTVILTTHDLDDVEQLCHRLIVINNGRVIEDGALDVLVARLAPERQIIIDFHGPPPEPVFHPHAVVTKAEENRVWLEFEKDKISAAQLIADLSLRYPIKDLVVKEPDIERLIKNIYSHSATVQLPVSDTTLTLSR